MTREEAIKILQGAIKKPNTKDGYLGQAIDMAIQALSQEPTKREIEREYLFQSLCEDFKILQAENDDLRKRLEQEPCTDAVSREAVMKIAKCISKKAMPKYIEKLPSVTPMSHYKSNPRKLSEKEKIDRLFVLAKEINVCVGNERKRDGRDIGVLP